VLYVKKPDGCPKTVNGFSKMILRGRR